MIPEIPRDNALGSSLKPAATLKATAGQILYAKQLLSDIERFFQDIAQSIYVLLAEKTEKNMPSREVLHTIIQELQYIRKEAEICLRFPEGTKLVVDQKIIQIKKRLSKNKVLVRLLNDEDRVYQERTYTYWYLMQFSVPYFPPSKSKDAALADEDWLFCILTVGTRIIWKNRGWRILSISGEAQTAKIMLEDTRAYKGNNNMEISFRELKHNATLSKRQG